MDNDRSVPAAPRYHPAAQGFTGDALDQLCKSRFTEGVEVGRAEAAEAAMQVIKEQTEAARREGHEEGVRVGFDTAKKELRQIVERDAALIREELRDAVHGLKSQYAQEVREIARDRVGRLYMHFTR
jgi:flagellar biosynthesis/type III secretory pathway protein FliH